MKKLTFFILFLLALCQTGITQNKKLAQTGMKFLTVPLDARSSALNGAMTAFEFGSDAMFYNPAGMARNDGFTNLSLGQVEWIADIDYVYGSASFKPSDGQYGVFGLTFVSVDYGLFNATIRAENEQGFIDVGEFTPTAYAIGFGYARALTDRFSIGGHVKYAHQNLVGGLVEFDETQDLKVEDFKEGVMVYDFGILYRTGFRSLNFGMSIRNFAEEIEYLQESFQLPLTFRIGVTMNILDFYFIDPERHALAVTMEASHPRDYPEQLTFATEYIFLEKFAFRLGYTSPTDEYNLSYGLGVMQDFAGMGFGLDYAFTPFGVLGDVHRISAKFKL